MNKNGLYDSLCMSQRCNFASLAELKTDNSLQNLCLLFQARDFSSSSSSSSEQSPLKHRFISAHFTSIQQYTKRPVASKIAFLVPVKFCLDLTFRTRRWWTKDLCVQSPNFLRCQASHTGHISVNHFGPHGM